MASSCPAPVRRDGRKDDSFRPEPAAGMRVLAEGGGVRRETLPGVRGDFAFEGLPPDPCSVRPVYPDGTDFFRVEGPNAGGAGINMIRTDPFAVQGKLFHPAIGLTRDARH